MTTGRLPRAVGDRAEHASISQSHQTGHIAGVFICQLLVVTSGDCPQGARSPAPLTCSLSEPSISLQPGGLGWGSPGLGEAGCARDSDCLGTPRGTDGFQVGMCVVYPDDHRVRGCALQRGQGGAGLEPR